jgi:hypothetical protein
MEESLKTGPLIFHDRDRSSQTEAVPRPNPLDKRGEGGWKLRSVGHDRWFHERARLRACGRRASDAQV